EARPLALVVDGGGRFRRRRPEHHLDAADANPIAIAELLRLLDVLVVPPRAILAAEVFESGGGRGEADHSMAPRDARRLEDDGTAIVAADDVFAVVQRINAP